MRDLGGEGAVFVAQRGAFRQAVVGDDAGVQEEASERGSTLAEDPGQPPVGKGGDKKVGGDGLPADEDERVAPFVDEGRGGSIDRREEESVARSEAAGEGTGEPDNGKQGRTGLA